MPKLSLSIILVFLFVGFLVTPTVIVAINDTVDVSGFYNATEEEEQNNIFKNSVVFQLSQTNELLTFQLAKGKAHILYRFKNYSKPNLNIISPPPEYL
ncbi:hypothetical protein ES677_06835 [Bizionia gelidisalsuginis]|uniref:Uncharacterized protein n=1 Tax=Bizionia gelidisalsuginis TaxID=291188 RepID=A0ABY3MAY9_9FLAO|nr:hypothetical protein [Bizionia gelidisalsuginis]TYC13440.1 hypothetical protein ES677_06835 [Bizionia gelidisalsuginis]